MTSSEMIRSIPDPADAEALRARLHLRLSSSEIATATDTRTQRHTERQEIAVTVDTDTDTSTSAGARPFRRVAAAVAVAAAVLVIAIWASRDNDADVPAGGGLSDREIAAATLLRGAEYAPGFNEFTPTGENSGGSGMKMDREIAAQVPACTPFLDTAFEGGTRAATVDYTFFTQFVPALEPQYVVVFPTEAGARAMYDAVTSPAFLDGCVPGYGSMTQDPPLGDPAYVAFPFATFGGTPTSAPLVTAPVDEISVRGYNEDGARFASATLRIDRVVVVVEGSMTYDTGVQVLSDEKFDLMLHRIAARARAALTGSPLP